MKVTNDDNLNKNKRSLIGSSSSTFVRSNGKIIGEVLNRSRGWNSWDGKDCYCLLIFLIRRKIRRSLEKKNIGRDQVLIG